MQNINKIIYNDWDIKNPDDQNDIINPFNC